ncbi:copper amine oxidase N-terminal domain-containing protein [Paenibacillus baekrokdamisoli]
MNRVVQTDTAPIMDQGSLYVPIRAVAESLGAKVEWNAKTQTATVRKWSVTLRLAVGKKSATVEGILVPAGVGNQKAGQMEVNASLKLVNNRVYVPLRLVSEQFGYRVNWDGRTVSIGSPLSAAQQKTLYEGDLASARKLAAGLSEQARYLQEPLDVTLEPEVYDHAYLFPEGEVLRFYSIYGDTVSLVQIQEDFPVAIWQAHLEHANSVKDFLEENIKDQRGTAPIIQKPFLYHTWGMSGVLYWEEYARVGLDHTFTKTGYKGSNDGKVSESGLTKLELPGEKRVDAGLAKQNPTSIRNK